jgi:hypothetical protein
MKTMLISYDLKSPETSERYATLITAIKALGSWAKPHYSLWLVKTDLTTVNVRDRLTPHLAQNDTILVIDVTSRAAAWSRLPTDVSRWIQQWM